MCKTHRALVRCSEYDYFFRMNIFFFYFNCLTWTINRIISTIMFDNGLTLSMLWVRIKPSNTPWKWTENTTSFGGILLFKIPRKHVSMHLSSSIHFTVSLFGFNIQRKYWLAQINVTYILLLKVRIKPIFLYKSSQTKCPTRNYIWQRFFFNYYYWYTPLFL